MELFCLTQLQYAVKLLLVNSLPSDFDDVDGNCISLI